MTTLFRVAMVNIFARAPFENPVLASDTVGEWIIVSRIQDAENNLIMISDAGSLDLNNIPTNAPDDIKPVNTFIGHLIRKESEEFESFILVRDINANLQIEGNFFPTDGFVLLNMSLSTLSIKASGRIDNGAAKFAWHFDAARVPWSHEMGIN